MRAFGKYWIVSAIALMLVVLTACAVGNAAQQPRLTAADTSTAANCWPGRPSPAERAAEAVATAFVARSNAGDTAGIAALLAANVKWDSVGTVFNGRDAVMQQLIIPAVIKTSGHYTMLAWHWDTYRLQVDYHFTSKAGDDVKLHYAYLISNGVIQDLVEYLD